MIFEFGDKTPTFTNEERAQLLREAHQTEEGRQALKEIMIKTLDQHVKEYGPENIAWGMEEHVKKVLGEVTPFIHQVITEWVTGEPDLQYDQNIDSRGYEIPFEWDYHMFDKDPVWMIQSVINDMRQCYFEDNQALFQYAGQINVMTNIYWLRHGFKNDPKREEYGDYDSPWVSIEKPAIPPVLIDACLNSIRDTEIELYGKPKINIKKIAIYLEEGGYSGTKGMLITHPDKWVT